jgi:hypothetical protein
MFFKCIYVISLFKLFNSHTWPPLLLSIDDFAVVI